MNHLTLSDLRVGESATIISVTEQDRGLGLRIAELGMISGEVVEVLHAAPSGDPIAVRVRGATYAIRKNEAEWVQVRREEERS